VQGGNASRTLEWQRSIAGISAKVTKGTCKLLSCHLLAIPVKKKRTHLGGCVDVNPKCLVLARSRFFSPTLELIAGLPRDHLRLITGLPAQC
jgi:hypothetical protein